MMIKQWCILLSTLFAFSVQVVSAQSDDNTDKALSKSQEPVKVHESISGAFGVLLGEQFKPEMVARVIAEQPKSYVGKNKTKLKGTLYQVEPTLPDARFQNYSVSTTGDGYVYSIMGEYQYEVERAKGKKAGKIKNQKTIRSNCKAAVKSLAEELESSYGKPRGKGWNGEWFSFRQISDNSDKSLRLYANRCRTGLYSIVYTDLKIQGGTQP